MENKEINIDINIIRPLQKVEVVNGQGIFKDGSIGYVSNISGALSHRTDLIHTVSFSKYGKRGKRRVSTDMIRCCAINRDGFTQDEWTKLAGTRLSDMSLKVINDGSLDVRSMDTYDFMCYLNAFSIFLTHLEAMEVKKPHILMSREYVLDNIVEINNLDIFNFGLLTQGINGRFKSNEIDDWMSLVAEHFDNTDNRTIFMDKAYKAMSAYKKTIGKYLARTVGAYELCAKTVLEMIYPQTKYNIKDLGTELRIMHGK